MERQTRTHIHKSHAHIHTETEKSGETETDRDIGRESENFVTVSNSSNTLLISCERETLKEEQFLIDRIFMFHTEDRQKSP